MQYLVTMLVVLILQWLFLLPVVSRVFSLSFIIIVIIIIIIEISKRQLHIIRLNHVLLDINKLSKDTTFMFTFAPFSSVKLTASKNFLIKFYIKVK